jgi:release factor glutamine methyltransferase
VGGDKDGLLFYRVIADKAKNLLSQEGIIAVECGFDQASQVQDLFSEKGMDTLLLMDLSGINRVVVARNVPKV